MATVLSQFMWLPFRNDSGETIPPHAVMRITGTSVIGDQSVLTVSKPNTTLERFYAINSAAAVASGRFGQATTGPPCMVRYDTAVTPAFGQSWGAKPSTWDLFPNRPGFSILGVLTNNRVPVVSLVHAVQEPITVIKCKPDANISNGGSGTASVWFNGTDSSDFNITLFNDWADNGVIITAAKEVIARWFGDEQEWHVIERECE